MEDYSVSAIIPAYNAGKYICRAIDSVLAQTLPVNEIIVVDDGSTDDTAQKVRAYGDKVRLIQKENGGVSSARNAGIDASSCEWVAFLDADDEWLPEKNMLQRELLMRNQDLVWAGGNYIRCQCGSGFRWLNKETGRIDSVLQGRDFYPDFFDAFLLQIYGHTSDFLVCKTIFSQIGGFPAGQKNSEDMDMWWRIAMHYSRFGFVNKPLSIYHAEVSGSLTRTTRNWGQHIDMIRNSLALANQCGRNDKFYPCAKYMVYRWMRSMLFDHRYGNDLKLFYKEFSYMYSLTFRIAMRVGMISPVMTELVCKGVGRMSRLLCCKTSMRPAESLECSCGN
ncbi:MAG: glycosyltransferase family 2 protein [Sedimentisphaerales bacterium]|nr:glycosyltransferase family 2 protein [Sedimentisphaerales bacterium]MBN2841864.1 glycosyltransferase family 2 protein [Sedimentisphaerales bacterium]